MTLSQLNTILKFETPKSIQKKEYHMAFIKKPKRWYKEAAFL